MTRKALLATAVLAAAMSLTAWGNPAAPQKTLKPFSSEAELVALFRGWAEQGRRRDEMRSAAPASAAPAPLAALAKAEVASAADSITNVQHAGVDEGGIVKLHGEHLVILRRGRLFTVEAGSLKPVSMVDAFGPDVDPRGAWYDELLVSGSTVVVIGYSYARGGTEIGLFDIAPSGALSYRATWHLRSNDYYSSRNYASRLIGSKLVFYTPLYLNPWHPDPLAQFPALRRWRGADSGEFRRIAPATRIYRSDEPLDPHQGVALHTVTTCDLASRELACESSAVLGPRGRVFYVSPESVYVWNVRSAVFRIPLDGAAPSALKVAGSPVDQFSFLEDDGFLNVLVRSHGRGEAMWSAERGAGELSLLRVPLAAFSDGRDSAPRESYRPLPGPAGGRVQNRFIGAHLVYGAGSNAYAARYAGDARAHAIQLPHRVERIEALGRHAVLVGSDGRDLHFSSVRLGSFPALVDRYTRPNARQGETRSHGFFYRADSNYEGLVGLPILGGSRGASLLYLRNAGLGLSEIGTLDAHPARMSDGCRASCVDWYGNSRPLFMRGRVLALMGYELVEGRVDGERIVEVARVDYARDAISSRIGLR